MPFEVASFLYFVLSLILTWFLTKLILPVLNSTFIDKPNKRSSHLKLTPTGGGIVFVVIGSLACLSLGFYAPLIATPLAIVGFADDKFDLSPKVRLAFQVITIILIYNYSPLHFVFTSDFNRFFSFIFVIIFIFIGVAFINFFNFIDGLDGLLAGCLTIILLTIAIHSQYALWPMVGTLIGFLILNWSPAKVFMGDGGSTFLGAVYVGSIFQSENIIELISLMTIATPVIIDPAICILRRIINKQAITKPHRLHLFQRLYLADWSHRDVSLLYMISTLGICISFLIGGLMASFTASLIVILFGFYLDRKKALPFLDIEY